MEKLVAKLVVDYPQIQFSPGVTNCWSPQSNQILYAGADKAAEASVIHELAHALLGHKAYASDLELLRKEVDAWDKAIELAQVYGVAISDDHIQHCLDTYRDWVHKRSLCPICVVSGLQQNAATYRCLNCSASWRVTTQRLSRPYRSTQTKRKAGV
jgi:hypothetical protein